MEIRPTDFVSSHKTGSISNLTLGQIQERLGFPPTSENDDKSEYTWEFTVDGVPCSIWDWKGSYRARQWSAYGPDAVLRSIFGANYAPYRL
jgi:hypothetical protein